MLVEGMRSRALGSQGLSPYKLGIAVVPPEPHGHLGAGLWAVTQLLLTALQESWVRLTPPSCPRLTPPSLQ